MKNLGVDHEKAKASYVAQGHKDKEKSRLVHNRTTLRQSSIRMIVSVAAVKRFSIFGHDVNQIYLQSDEKIWRKIILLPKKNDLEGFGLEEHEILELLRLLYGTCDAGDCWGVTVQRHITGDLKMILTAGDPSLYLKQNNEDVDGIMGNYIDGAALAGNEAFQKLTEKRLWSLTTNQESGTTSISLAH